MKISIFIMIMMTRQFFFVVFLPKKKTLIRMVNEENFFFSFTSTNQHDDDDDELTNVFICMNTKNIRWLTYDVNEKKIFLNILKLNLAKKKLKSKFYMWSTKKKGHSSKKKNRSLIDIRKHEMSIHCHHHHHHLDRLYGH